MATTEQSRLCPICLLWHGPRDDSECVPVSDAEYRAAVDAALVPPSWAYDPAAPRCPYVSPDGWRCGDHVHDGWAHTPMLASAFEGER